MFLKAKSYGIHMKLKSRNGNGIFFNPKFFIKKNLFFAAGTTKDPKCRSSEECKNNEKCFKGVCTDACRVEPCGVNAQCIGKKHQAVCSCPPGYIGSPYFECSSCKFHFSFSSPFWICFFFSLFLTYA